jgi:hypothetical protein
MVEDRFQICYRLLWFSVEIKVFLPVKANTSWLYNVSGVVAYLLYNIYSTRNIIVAWFYQRRNKHFRDKSRVVPPSVAPFYQKHTRLCLCFLELQVVERIIPSYLRTFSLHSRHSLHVQNLDFFALPTGSLDAPQKHNTYCLHHIWRNFASMRLFFYYDWQGWFIWVWLSFYYYSQTNVIHGKLIGT